MRGPTPLGPATYQSRDALVPDNPCRVHRWRVAQRLDGAARLW